MEKRLFIVLLCAAAGLLMSSPAQGARVKFADLSTAEERRKKLGSVLLTFEEEDLTATSTFKDLSSGHVLHSGRLAGLTANINNLEATITRRDRSRFDIIDNNIQQPRAHPDDIHNVEKHNDEDDDRNGRWGRRSIDPFFSFNRDLGAASSPFLITFDKAIHVFSVLLGDHGGDTDIINLRAFTSDDGSGAPVLTTADTLVPRPRGPKSFRQQHVSFKSKLNILSVEILGGSNTGRTRGKPDLMSVFLDRVFFSPEKLDKKERLIRFLDNQGVFDEDEEGDPGVKAVIPGPLSAAALVPLVPWLLLRRRRII